MMPRKTVNIILIAAVLGLWGMIAYRFVRNLAPTATVPIEGRQVGMRSSDLSVKRDTFGLQPLERDPFLGRIHKPKSRKVSPKRAVSAPKKQTPAPAPWPEVAYYGYIKAGKNPEAVILKVNGQMLRLHTGETRDNLTVIRIHRDSVELKYAKENRTFRH